MSKKIPSEENQTSSSGDPSRLASSKGHNLLKLELLKRIDLFKYLPEETQKDLVEQSRELVLEKDEILLKEGEKDEKINFYVILSGHLLIYKGDTFRNRIAILSSGEYLGEMTMVDAEAHSASAVALDESVLMIIPKNLFEKHIASDHGALLEMVKVFSHRMRSDLDVMAGDMQKVSNFTHDMRNCLVPLGYADVYLSKAVDILKGTDPRHKKREGWDMVEKSFNTMISVRKNLITLIDQSLACVKKTKSEYVKAEAQVLPLIQETVDEISCHKVLKKKNIVVQENVDLKSAHFNFLDIKRVLQNLLLNAGYASEKDGTIEITLTDGNGYNQISIIDNGAGIPEHIQPILLRENFTSKPDGNGFGLMSCREIIEDFHLGKIWFDSEFNHGATFHFTIPHFDAAANSSRK